MITPTKQRVFAHGLIRIPISSWSPALVQAPRLLAARSELIARLNDIYTLDDNIEAIWPTVLFVAERMAYGEPELTRSSIPALADRFTDQLCDPLSWIAASPGRLRQLLFCAQGVRLSATSNRNDILRFVYLAARNELELVAAEMLEATAATDSIEFIDKSIFLDRTQRVEVISI